MNGIFEPERLRLADAFLAWGIAQGIFSSINWLWVAGAAFAAWLIISAMNRRQVRLTTLLRDHVTRTQEAQAPPPDETPDAPADSPD